jgi:hypothetical protein
MSQPTVLSPWFIVQRLRADGHMEFYQSAVEGDGTFTTVRVFSMLFMSLQSASRVAEAEAAEVRALFNKEHAREFGRQ